LKISLDEKEYIVSIPFRDQGLEDYIGRNAIKSRLFNVTYTVSAKTPKDAKKMAIDLFKKSEVSFQYNNSPPNYHSNNQVDILENKLVAQETDK